jgi:hypothetical protein
LNVFADCELDKPGQHTPVEITMELKARVIELLLRRLMAQSAKRKFASSAKMT